MRPVMRALNLMAERTGAAVLLVAHDRKNADDVAGSYVIRAACKVILRLLLPRGTEVDPDEGPLVLSTIHSAKGLEWHSVFIIWALEGRFPSYYNVNTEEELEEERRLLYVASTRAKENLFVTYPIKIFDRGLRTVLSRPSQFIEGIPEELLEPVTLVEEEEERGWED
ncbi:MAG: ATP-binding domain-containing protein [Deltaproteobacteria bacterium]|nr:ATP-binding domain-containing protein [Deltaproteobacteria bacterium]